MSMDDLAVNHWLTLPGRDMDWHAARSGGPGGQNVNKVNTKVDLRFDLEGTSALAPAVKARLRRLAGTRIDAQGRIAITASASRSQSTNLQEARERLRQLVLKALHRPKARKKTKATRGSQRRRLKDKRARSETKKQRGKVDY